MNKNFTKKTAKTQRSKRFFRKLFPLLALFLLTYTISSANSFFDLVVTSTDVSCGGIDDGTATATPLNGWAPFTYSWSNGATTSTISDLAPGIYEVTVVSSDLAIQVGSTVVGESDGMDLYLSASYETCAGSSDASASVNVSGGNGALTYLWSTGETFVVASDLSAGTYTVTVTDENGCTASGSIEVELSPEGVWIMGSSTDADCGAANGTAHISVMTGVAPFTIVWSDGQMGEDATGLSAGTYGVTVTDSNGCSNSETLLVGSDSELSLSISGTDSDCGLSNGSATVNVNGSGNYQYSWSNGATTSTISNLDAGEYTVTVEDASGCSNSASITIDATGNLDLSISGTDAECNANNGSATVSVDPGNGNYTYAWSNGGNTATITGLGTGTYTVTVQDGNGCSSVSSVTINEVAGIVLNISGTDGECGLDNSSATVSASGGNGNYLYSWSNGGTTATITGLAAGTYTVTVQDGNGCSNEASVSVSNGSGVVLSISGTDATCNMNDGSATANVGGGTPPYSYEWSNGSTSASINDLAPGTYNLIVTDANNCASASSVTINGIVVDGGVIATSDLLLVCAGDGNDDIVNTTLNGNIGENSIYVFTTTDGEILGTGDAPPFNFEGAGVGTCVIWHLSFQDGLTGLTIGQNISDLAGCFDFSNGISITREECCTVVGGEVSSTDNLSICAGDGVDDFVNVSLTGAVGSEQTWLITSLSGDILGMPLAPPFNFEGAGAGTCLIWSISYEPGLTGLMMGANIADLDGCYALSTSSVEVVRNDSPGLTLSANDAACNNDASGSITTAISGGTAPFTYNWSNGTTTSDLIGFEAGTYTLTLTDANGCSDVASATIGEPTAINITFDGGDETCDSSNGFATVSASGGTPGYTYLWSNGATTATVNGLSAGTYGVTLTDSNGCTASNASAVTITNNGISSCAASVTSSYNEGVDISSFGGSDGTASANGNGGVLPYSFMWSNGETDANITGLSAGTYSVIVTDALGCTCESNVTLNDPSKIGNFVWEDLDRDGIQDANEPGINGITVNLTGTANDGSNVNRTTSTSGNGAYSFDGLPAGNYKVTFSGGNYKSSPLNAGGDDALDSDANPDTGMTEFFDLGIAECNNDVDAGLYECVNIGDFVFYDGNRDGVQQPWEAGVPDALVRLMTVGPDGIYCTNDDVVVDGIFTENDGRYLFECVEPGTYYVEFIVNTQDYAYTGQNQGTDDNLDSDANSSNGKTDLFTVTEGQTDDLSFDAGIYLFCDDFSTGGQIGSNQELCPGETAVELTSISMPTGGYGDAEFLWLSSNSGGALDNGTWIEIPNSDSPNYAPGQVYSTTYYIRCARRENCNDFVAESNVVVIVVNPCVNGFIQNLNANIIALSEVSIEWSTEPEFDLFMYHIERSVDGVSFEEIGTANGQGNVNGMNQYEFMDHTPRMGRNVYRIMRQDMTTGNLIYSNNVEIMFNPNEERFFVYPNPTSHTLFVESLHNMNGNATLELYTSTGKLIETIEVDEQIGKATFDFNKYAAGPYFIKVRFEGKDDIDVIRIIKE